MSDDRNSADCGSSTGRGNTYSEKDILTALGNRRLGTREVADVVGCHRATAYERLEEMEEQGLVEATEVGRTLMWIRTRKPQLGNINHTVLRRALDKWGEEAQMFMAFEEMGELQTELSRSRRGRSDKELVAEEIADALIMIHQMALVCGTEAVSAAVERKMERLEMKVDSSD